MSSIQSHRLKSANEAKGILQSGPTFLDALSSSLASSTPYKGSTVLSTAEEAFFKTISSNVESSNAAVDALYKSTRDACIAASSNIRTLERFIGLHVPQMEDGNNFGVTVQMMMNKFLKEERERCEKILSETSKYYASRADVIDKFTHLPKSTTTETMSTSQSSSTGGKDGDESKTSSSTSTEKKSTKNEEPVNLHRVKALAALDAQMYVDLMGGMQAVIHGYMIILDNLEKNWEKLENPRGKGYGGYGSGGSSMVY